MHRRTLTTALTIARFRLAGALVGSVLLLSAAAALAQERHGDPGQAELHADLDQVSDAARSEADRERARRLAPFDLWWAVR